MPIPAPRQRVFFATLAVVLGLSAAILSALPAGTVQGESAHTALPEAVNPDGWILSEVTQYTWSDDLGRIPSRQVLTPDEDYLWATRGSVGLTEWARD